MSPGALRTFAVTRCDDMYVVRVWYAFAGMLHLVPEAGPRRVAMTLVEARAAIPAGLVRWRGEGDEVVETWSDPTDIPPPLGCKGLPMIPDSEYGAGCAPAVAADGRRGRE